MLQQVVALPAAAVHGHAQVIHVGQQTPGAVQKLGGGVSAAGSGGLVGSLGGRGCIPSAYCYALAFAFDNVMGAAAASTAAVRDAAAAFWRHVVNAQRHVVAGT